MGKVIIWTVVGTALAAAGVLVYGGILVTLDERAAKREQQNRKDRQKRERAGAAA